MVRMYRILVGERSPVAVDLFNLQLLLLILPVWPSWSYRAADYSSSHHQLRCYGLHAQSCFFVNSMLQYTYYKVTKKSFLNERKQVHVGVDGTQCRDGVKVLWCNSHLVCLVFWRFHPYIHLFSFRKLFCDLFLLFISRGGRGGQEVVCKVQNQSNKLRMTPNTFIRSLHFVPICHLFLVLCA